MKGEELNSRERVETTLLHEEPDRIPLDLGGSAVTGMHVSTVYALRQALMLDQPGTPVKVTEPFQILGEIKADLWEVLGVEIACLGTKYNMFGYENAGWKPWILFDGTPVEVPNRFNTVPEKNGDILMYPRGDDTVEPCARMPKGGFYFDAIDRQLQLNWNHLNPEDNLEEFTSITNDECKYIEPGAGFTHRSATSGGFIPSSSPARKAISTSSPTRDIRPV